MSTVEHGEQQWVDGQDGWEDEPDGQQLVDQARPAQPRWLPILLAAVTAVALVVVGGALAVATGVGRTAVPADDSLDAGFARDMTAHHDQATQMAQVVRDGGTDPAVRLLAYDIETQQLGQMGQMRGWLQVWGLAEQTNRPRMSWMPASLGHVHGGLMPGMGHLSGNGQAAVLAWQGARRVLPATDDPPP